MEGGGGLKRKSLDNHAGLKLDKTDQEQNSAVAPPGAAHQPNWRKGGLGRGKLSADGRGGEGEKKKIY